MKHKLIKLISVMVIATFTWQSLPWGNTKGERVLTGVRIAKIPLSPSQKWQMERLLRPMAMGEKGRVRTNYRIKIGEGVPIGYKRLINPCIFDRQGINILLTAAMSPLVALMNNHSGGYETLELARLAGIIYPPAILVRLDDHDDLDGLFEDNIYLQPATMELVSEPRNRYTNLNFTVPLLYYGGIDEIYLIQNGNTTKRPLTYDAVLFEATTKDSHRRFIGITLPPILSLDDYKILHAKTYESIREIRKIRVHIITDPSQMPDLSGDRRSVVWDVDGDWHFGLNDFNFLKVRRSLRKGGQYLRRIKRMPDVIILALSSETTGSIITESRNCHTEFVRGWVCLFGNRGVSFITDEEGAPIGIPFEQAAGRFNCSPNLRSREAESLKAVLSSI